MAPRWVVTCPECEKEFTHTPISKISRGMMRDLFASPPKPQIPQNGAGMECPSCHKTSVFRAVDLRFRAD
jgi:hypothetical protein